MLIALAAVTGCVSRPAPARIVCLGDSITDGNTYPQILMQALNGADLPVPPVVCAGIAGNTAEQMAARLDRDVRRFTPMLVTFSAGTNDAHQGISPERYETALRQIVTTLQADKVAMILLTPCLVLPVEGRPPEKQAAIEALLDAYEAIVRRVAAEYELTVAENRARQQEAVDRGETIMVEDGLHPNYVGQAIMARAILDAMGHPDVALPNLFAPRLFPGVVTPWRAWPTPVAEAATAETIASLEPSAEWPLVELPQPAADDAPGPEEWWQQLRANGFAIELDKRFGKGRLRFCADLETKEERQTFLNLGGPVDAVWLNGEKLHQQSGWTGFHAGRERYPVTLRPGTNRLLIEVTGNCFFVSLTDDLVWEASLFAEQPAE